MFINNTIGSFLWLNTKIFLMPHFFDRKETPRPELRLLINCNCSASSGQTHFVQTMPALTLQNKTFIARYVKVGRGVNVVTNSCADSHVVANG